MISFGQLVSDSANSYTEQSRHILGSQGSRSLGSGSLGSLDASIEESLQSHSRSRPGFPEMFGLPATHFLGFQVSGPRWVLHASAPFATAGLLPASLDTREGVESTHCIVSH